MTLIICVDNKMGILFNHRRQSQDTLLRKRVLEYADGSLFMTAYSAKQFLDFPEARITVCGDPIDVPPDGYWFAEGCVDNNAPVEKILLYRWNRDYPADAYFHFPSGLDSWKLLSSNDFPGFSHETITEETYILKEDP